MPLSPEFVCVYCFLCRIKQVENNNRKTIILLQRDLRNLEYTVGSHDKGGKLWVGFLLPPTDNLEYFKCLP